VYENILIISCQFEERTYFTCDVFVVAEYEK